MKKNQKKNKTNSSSKTKVKNSSKDLKKSLDLISIELEDYKDKNLRLLAEFENFKKRSEHNILDSYVYCLSIFLYIFLRLLNYKLHLPLA